MPYLTNDGIKIYYETEGEGPPVVMVHGFASNIQQNWKQTNWVNTLKENYQLILSDVRGHGKSDKPHEESYYGYQKMTSDIIKLMEYLSIGKANFFGYSMGAYMTFHLLLRKPELLISAILGGFVLNFSQNEKERKQARENIILRIEAFKAENIDQVKNLGARAFRQFAELGGNDLNALAALLTGELKQSPEGGHLLNIQVKSSLKKVKKPVMTVVGSNEFIPGDKTLVAQLVPGACHFQIQGKDHLTVVPDPKFKIVVKAFLDYVNRR